MILYVSSKAPHCEGNESQDTVVRLEIVLMSTERETRLQEEEGYMKSTGWDQELMSNMDEVREWWDSRLPLVGDKGGVAATVKLDLASGGRLGVG